MVGRKGPPKKIPLSWVSQCPGLAASNGDSPLLLAPQIRPPTTQLHKPSQRVRPREGKQQQTPQDALHARSSQPTQAAACPVWAKNPAAAHGSPWPRPLVATTSQPLLAGCSLTPFLLWLTCCVLLLAWSNCCPRGSCRQQPAGAAWGNTPPTTAQASLRSRES